MKINVFYSLSKAFSPQFPPNSHKTLPPKNLKKLHLYGSFTSHNSLLNTSITTMAMDSMRTCISIRGLNQAKAAHLNM